MLKHDCFLWLKTPFLLICTMEEEVNLNNNASVDMVEYTKLNIIGLMQSNRWLKSLHL